MDGIYLIDKQVGISSYDVIRKLKKVLNTKKIGHAGTLDPFASGLLVVLVGKATKLSNLFINDDKTYTGSIYFGKSTDTYDKEGQTTKKLDDFNITDEDIIRAFNSFVGTISQTPPIYSAIKQGGKKLYEYARSNADVIIKKRTVTIYDFIQTSKLKDNITKFKVSTSKGTYIRSLAHDVGEVLNVPSHLNSLMRVKSGAFKLDDAYSYEDLDKVNKPSISIKEFAEGLEKVVIKDYLIRLIYNGVELDKRQNTTKNIFSVYTEQGTLLAIYMPKGDKYKPLIILGDNNEDL